MWWLHDREERSLMKWKIKISRKKDITGEEGDILILDLDQEAIGKDLGEDLHQKDLTQKNVEDIKNLIKEKVVPKVADLIVEKKRKRVNNAFPNHIQDANIQERNQDLNRIRKGLKVQEDQDQDIILVKIKKKEKLMHDDDKNDKVKW